MVPHADDLNVAIQNQFVLTGILLTTIDVEFDSEVRFRALAAPGKATRGLEMLDKLDKNFQQA
jgi:hypothetical protein